MSRYFLFLFCLTGFSAFSQTKLIFHKSHSGSNETFEIAYGSDMFEMSNSNFGMAPERTVRTAALDSLIFISDTVAVMVTSEYCKKPYSKYENKTTKWKAGKDTVYNHPLFNRKNSIGYIKSTLKNQYYFQNSPDSIAIINGPCNDEDEKEPILLTIPPTPGNTNGSGPPPLTWLLSMAGFSILAASLLYLISNKRKTASFDAGSYKPA